MFKLHKLKVKRGVFHWKIVKVDESGEQTYRIVKSGAKALGLVRLLNGQPPVGFSTARF